jgi:hypothetical protein
MRMILHERKIGDLTLNAREIDGCDVIRGLWESPDKSGLGHPKSHRKSLTTKHCDLSELITKRS